MAVRFGIPVLLATTLALAACAGSHGAGGFAPVATQPQSAPFEAPDAVAKVAMKYSITIPAAKPAVGEAQRHEQFVAASTQSIKFQIYTAKSTHVAANLLQTVVVALNAGAAGCTAAKARVCSGTLNLPPPAVDIVASTYDRKPAGKKIPATAKQLATANIVNLTVAKRKNIPLAISLGGIPVSVVVTIPGSTVVSGVQTLSIHGVGQSSTAIGVQALDADGNIILTDGYVNAAGQKTVITVKVTTSHTTCGSGKLQNGTSAAATSIKLSAPSKGIAFVYGSIANASLFSSAGYCSFTLAVTPAGTGGAFVLSGPQLSEYPVPNSDQARAIVSGPDGNIWFTNGVNGLGKINVSTKAITTYPAIGPTIGLVSSGGYLWTNNYGTFSQVSTSGAVVHSYTFSDPGGQAGKQIATDPSGNFWFADGGNQKVIKITPTGTVSTYAPLTPASAYPEGIAKGPDENMWFTECGGSRIERISPTGTNAQEFALPGAYPYLIVTGSDGNLWFTSCAAHTISKFVPTGANAGQVTVFPAPVAAGSTSQPYGLISGPDQAIWFADHGYPGIDRIPVDAADASQIAHVPTSHAAWFVTTGPDGAMWFTENDPGTPVPVSYIGRLVY